jgi:hypothetical protein
MQGAVVLPPGSTTRQCVRYAALVLQCTASRWKHRARLPGRCSPRRRPPCPRRRKACPGYGQRSSHLEGAVVTPSGVLPCTRRALLPPGSGLPFGVGSPSVLVARLAHNVRTRPQGEGSTAPTRATCSRRQGQPSPRRRQRSPRGSTSSHVRCTPPHAVASAPDARSTRTPRRAWSQPRLGRSAHGGLVQRHTTV